MDNFLLSYDTVTLYPKHSRLPTRDLANTSLEFLDRKFNLPVVPANMLDVISQENAKFLSENDYFYIFHRFGEYNTEHVPIHSFVAKANDEKWKLISISIGMHETDRNLLMCLRSEGYRIDFITIDVAHADHKNIRPMVNIVRATFPDAKLIVGNVATEGGVEYLCRLSVDGVKVGIGGGSICTTRYMTGFHLPTLQSVFDANIAMEKNGWNTPIIADGGAKHYGDVAKALVFGASMVMSGGWFASCIDSPAQIKDGKKIYRGSTSYELKGQRRHIEGRQLELDGGTTYAQRLSEIKEALQSSISYSGGTDLSSLKSVEWGRIFPFH
jgi:GMP reductase